jgi:hypothetical protein
MIGALLHKLLIMLQLFSLLRILEARSLFRNLPGCAESGTEGLERFTEAVPASLLCSKEIDSIADLLPRAHCPLQR